MSSKKFTKQTTLIKACLFFSLASCGSDSNDEKTSNPLVVERKVISTDFDFVGVITSFDSLRCSGVLLAHGLFVSARHCFSETEVASGDFSNFDIVFPNDGIVDDNDEKITVSSIEYDTVASDTNDIAYVFYDPALTDGKVDILPVSINTGDAVEAGTLMTTVGFPSSSDRVLRKVGTFDCVRLERSGIIEPSRFDTGYEGILYDTNCAAWKGNSGGGFFTVKYDAQGRMIPLSLEGVVTHTFDLTPSGSIDPTKTGLDSFGTYVQTVNYSAFKDATRLQALLNQYK